MALALRTTKRAWLGFLCATVLSASAAFAVQPDEILPDPGLEARARALSSDLRCLVCQNQSIDDSNAPLARDLRLLVRERLKAGDDDRAVMNFVVARYGDFVLLKPPFKLSTLALWAAPLIVLLSAIWFAVSAGARRRGMPDAGRSLTGEEQQKLEALLRDDPSSRS